MSVAPLRGADSRVLTNAVTCLDPREMTGKDELGQRCPAVGGWPLSQLQTGSATPPAADRAHALGRGFCNANQGAAVSDGAGVALADRPKGWRPLARFQQAPTAARVGKQGCRGGPPWRLTVDAL